MKSKHPILCAFIFVLMGFPSFSQIKTNPVPTSTLAVTVSGPAYVCNGSPAMLCAAASGGIGAYTYSWAPGSGTSSCTTAYPSTNTTYTVMVEYSTGASVFQA